MLSPFEAVRTYIPFAQLLTSKVVSLFENKFSSDILEPFISKIEQFILQANLFRAKKDTSQIQCLN